uniref:HEAT repeat-containing protein 1 n=1 Tax=Callorhinchus milii TaxID=7868 RepID=A0A4W3IM76_CALMI
MTSLAYQLKRLALPQNDPSLLKRSEVASLLFTQSEAASIDRDTFFAIGCTGLEELSGIDSSFEEFNSTLFSQASKDVERSVQSKSVNAQLDESILVFLTRLSPYFMLKPAQKCLEWLIQRFHIHLYNQDSLIGCVLPYHETKVFVRVIQLLKLSDPTHRWHWLEPIQKPGVPLAKNTLINHCYKDMSFMDFICNLVTKAGKAFLDNPGNAAQLRVLFSFYASTIVLALDAVETITDTIIAKLLPYVQKGLKSSWEDYRSATYMIICQLAVKVVMEASLVNTLAQQVSRTLAKKSSLTREGLSCLVILLQNQKRENISKKTFAYLCSVPDLSTVLQDIDAQYNVSPLLHYFLPKLLHSVTGTGVNFSSDTPSAFNQKIKPLVRLLETRYPKAYDAALEERLRTIISPREQDVFNQFVSLSLSSAKHQLLADSDTSLLLSLNHPQPAVRNFAVQHLKEIIESSQVIENFIVQNIVSFCQEDTVSHILSLFHQVDLTENDQWCSVLEEAIMILSTGGLLDGNEVLTGQVLTELLPYMILTNPDRQSAEQKITVFIANSGLCSLTPLLHGWPEDAIECSKSSRLVGEANEKLIQILVTNMCQMEPSTKTWTVSLMFTFFTAPVSGQTWWNPESLDKQNCDYLRLLIGLFDIIICGSSEGSLVGSFRILMQLLFQTHLPNTNSLFMFLNLLWTYNFNLGNQINCTINAVLQTRALYMGRVLLTDQSAGQRGMLASLSSPVLISLVICLGSPVREVRRGAIGCLQTLMLLRGTVFYQVIDKLVNLGEEIISDHRHLPQVFSSLFEQLLTQSKPNAQNKRLTEALENFMQCIVDPEWPSYIARCLLNTLEEVNGELMMSKLRPLLERFLEKESGTFRKDEALLLHMILRKYNKYSAPFLATHIRSMNFFLSAMNNSKELYRGLPTLQVIALGQITKEFFAALPDGKIQQKLLGVLFDLLVQCKNPACAQLIGNVFKGITVDAEQIAQEFGSLQKPQSQATVQQKRRQKMLQRKSQELQGAEPVPPIDNVYWQRVTLILELMQHKKKLKRPQILIPALFSLLSRCLDPSLSEEASLEYTKQLLLNCLLNLCQKLSPDGTKISKDVLDEEKFNVELIVQCVRGSNVPQTHHHALLLLGTAAGIFPDKVLHNIMPIFTFMGANVMRLDDSYSFKVINNTVKTVIPALIQANDEGSVEIKEHVNKVVTNIIHVFVDALPHVPEHRRLPILSQLIDTVSAERFLWVLLLLLFEQHVTKTSAPANGDKEAILERDVEFWISVCCEFGVQEQLLSLMNMLRYLAKLPEDKEGKRKATSELLFNVETHSAKQLRHFKFLSVSFMVQLLASNSFVAESDECEHETLQKLEQSLLEEILCYINVVARCVEENAEKPTAKFWRSLLNRSYDVLDKVNALLPTETFIPVIRGLMSNPLPSVRRKAMDLLNNKLQQHKTAWQDHQVTLLLNLIEDLLSIVSSKEKEEEEQAVNRQTALYSLKLLCKCFGTNQQNPFVPVLTTAVDLITGDSEEERNVLASALLCVAEVTSALKALAIPQLPRLMPGLLKMLRNHKALLSNEIYLLSAVAALQKVTETLPHFISPYLLGILTQVSIHLSTKLAPRVLLPAVSKCYNKLVDTNQNCLGPLMLILKENISHMEKEQLNSHQSELTSFFLKALDFRADHLEVDLDKVSEIEGHIINCLIVMVMKLSEITFRPLFFKLFDWSKSEGQPKDRMITFSRLADCIADKLKGLFTLFAGNLVKPFADILNQTNSVKTDEAFFDSKWNTEKSCLLLQFVINCLHKIFLYDTHRFVSKERADALMMPLVDQLENMLGGEEKYKERVVTHVIPCVAQFSVALGDDSLWKPLNYQILLKTRDSLAKVRFSALLMLLELASKLKENYMLLLPEAIPFLAELLEDESEEVENQCQKVIQQLEVILGEPLQSYF